jgi:hypothetical protein
MGIGGALSSALGAGAVPSALAARTGATAQGQTAASTSAWLFVVFQILSLLAAIGGGAAGALENSAGEEVAEQASR